MKQRWLVLTVLLSLLLVVALSPVAAQDFDTPATYGDLSTHRPVLVMAEIITNPDSGEPGRVEWLRQDLGNRQLDHDFVYGDPRRMLFNGGNPGITYAVNTGFQSADSNLTNQIGALYFGVQGWDAETCSDLTLSERWISPGQPGVVQTFFSTGDLPLNWVADLTQVGMLSGAQFPYFAANPNVLGVTFTLMWDDGNGNLTDIDGNGKADVAFREIYYNDDHNWSDNGNLGVPGARIFDLPTVSLHEAGHGFSQAHFGSIGVQNNTLVARPRAVMNAIYGGQLLALTGNDRGGHCSNWAQWPNN